MEAHDTEEITEIELNNTYILGKVHKYKGTKPSFVLSVVHRLYGSSKICSWSMCPCLG